jgi:hypothetical protein
MAGCTVELTVGLTVTHGKFLLNIFFLGKAASQGDPHFII